VPSKWLTWTPETANSANGEPTKPTKDGSEHSKAGFVGFVGGGEHIFPEFTTPAGEGPRVFPHCPRCASYALYRRNNIGNYECQTCGLIDITEAVARRIQ
jgi:hypothetical protein